MLVTCSGEVFVTFKSLHTNNRTANHVDETGTKRQTNKKHWKKQGILRCATWNVQGISYKEDQLDDILNTHQIKIAAITETKKKQKGTKNTNNYLQIYSGVPREIRAQAGVMLMIHRSLQSSVDSYTFWDERIIEARIKLSRGFLTILGLYAPADGDPEKSEDFYNKIQDIISKIPKTNMLLILGDINARIGNIEIRENIGKYGEQTCNANGLKLRDFVVYNNLKIMNSFFKHKDIHTFTWHARGLQSVIDYVICNDKLYDYVLDVRVYRGPELETDHYLVISPIRIPPRWYKKKKKDTTNRPQVFKVDLLRDPSIRWLFEQRVETYLQSIKISDDIEEEWLNLTTILKKAAAESIGLRNTYKRKRNIRKWDEDIKTIINDKRTAYLKFLQTKNIEDHIIYKQKRAIARRATRKKHREEWNTFISSLERDVTLPRPKTFKILKKLNSDIKENVTINPININDWLKYFQNLWSIPNISSHQLSSNDSNTEIITFEELSSTLQNFKNCKAPGEDGMNMELFKYAGEQFTYRLLYFLNLIWNGLPPPISWQKAIVIPIYKKGDKKNCDNYRGISLLNTGYKIYSNIIKNKLSTLYADKLGEEQSGFRRGRSCCDNYFTLKLLVEKHREFNYQTHIGFIDFVKAFDRVDRQKLLEILVNDSVPTQFINAIYNIYSLNEIAIQIDNRLSAWAPINQGVRQGCGLSPLLFIIYLNHIIHLWRQKDHAGISLCHNYHLDALLFADDLAILATTENDLQRAVYNLQNIATQFNMTISTQKTKVMAFLGKEPIQSKILVNNVLVERVNSFNYLGYHLSFIEEEDMKFKITKFIKILGAINLFFKPSQVQRHTRIRLYKTLARPVLSYGSEAWTIRKADARRLTAAEMRFMRRTAGYTLLDHKRNEDILKELNMDSITNYVHQHRWNWKEHVNRMPSYRLPQLILRYIPRGRRDLGRPRKRWAETVTDH